MKFNKHFPKTWKFFPAICFLFLSTVVFAGEGTSWEDPIIVGPGMAQSAMSWEQTITVEDVYLNDAGDLLVFPYTKEGPFEQKDIGEGEVLYSIGNVWLIQNLAGVYYATAFEYLRAPKQQAKMYPISIIGNRHLTTPMTWVPGDTYGLMVTTFARAGHRTTDERSNIFLFQMPFSNFEADEYVDDQMDNLLFATFNRSTIEELINNPPSEENPNLNLNDENVDLDDPNVYSRNANQAADILEDIATLMDPADPATSSTLFGQAEEVYSQYAYSLLMASSTPENEDGTTNPEAGTNMNTFVDNLQQNVNGSILSILESWNTTLMTNYNDPNFDWSLPSDSQYVKPTLLPDGTIAWNFSNSPSILCDGMSENMHVEDSTLNPQNCTLVIDDPLLGSTIGEQHNGMFNDEGFSTTTGDDHILYRLEQPVKEGYVEFEVRGMLNDLFPTDSDHAFFVQYDARQISIPVKYTFDYKHNHYRWNVHYRQNRCSIKCVIITADQEASRELTTVPVFADTADRDWYNEPTGSKIIWDPMHWYKFRIQWVNKIFSVYLDDKLVWECEGPNDYHPVVHHMRLASGPGKYNSQMDGLVYRNFKAFRKNGSEELPQE